MSDSREKAFSSAALILLATLTLGIIIGVLGSASLKNVRDRQLDRARQVGGFVEHLESIIQPTQAQQDQVRSILEDADETNRQIRFDANEELRLTLETLGETLAPILTADQARRLQAFIRRPGQGGGQLGPEGGPPRQGPGARPGPGGQGGPGPGGPPPGGRPGVGPGGG